MHSIKYIIAICVVAVAGTPEEDGKWHPYKYGQNGKYIPTDEGKYIHIPNPYIHIDNPYNGGFGPYTHDYEPYVSAATEDRYRLVMTPPKDIPYYKDGYYKNNGIKIISQKHVYDEDKYDFNFETENKIRAKENAILKNPNTIDEGIASSGFYEYLGPDGFMYRVDYTADENGFRPKVKRLETPYSGKWVLEKVN
ncbi:PREDICTED: larval cuticle protein LCP-22-like [Papilio xuthus]|uniref:Cuticular protein PxutCPR1 n=1 Tax=Papilio xuthus TaxID=66420 RepID=I4DIF4_PAPXU|nr:larval cuticle protein LCP-22-like precursor [Papilio xuthus]BAM17694.1 cuticular protein PxutCPR1 [Papilio xuthus]